MKAIVLEIKHGVAAVLREDGEIIKIRRNCKVGETIIIDAKAHRISARMIRYLSAAAMIVLIILGSGHAYYTAFACSYVSLDINPSIEYTLNRMDEVIDVQALNDEAVPIVQKLIAQGCDRISLQKAINQTLALLYDQNYISTENESYMLIAVSTDNEKHKNKLSSAVSEAIAQDSNAKLQVYFTTASSQDHQTAQNLGISTGRYEMIKSIKIGDSQADTDQTPLAISQTEIEQYKEMPVVKLVQNVQQTGDIQQLKIIDHETAVNGVNSNNAGDSQPGSGTSAGGNVQGDSGTGKSVSGGSSSDKSSAANSPTDNQTQNSQGSAGSTGSGAQNFGGADQPQPENNNSNSGSDNGAWKQPADSGQSQEPAANNSGNAEQTSEQLQNQAYTSVLTNQPALMVEVESTQSEQNSEVIDAAA